MFIDGIFTFINELVSDVTGSHCWIIFPPWNVEILEGSGLFKTVIGSDDVVFIVEDGGVVVFVVVVEFCVPCKVAKCSNPTRGWANSITLILFPSSFTTPSVIIDPNLKKKKFGGTFS